MNKTIKIGSTWESKEPCDDTEIEVIAKRGGKVQFTTTSEYTTSVTDEMSESKFLEFYQRN